MKQRVSRLMRIRVTGCFSLRLPEMNQKADWESLKAFTNSILGSAINFVCAEDMADFDLG